MRKIVLLVFTIFCILNVDAQETTLDKVSLEICEYFEANKEEMDKMSYDEKVANFGLKMMESYIDHKDELEKEGIKFDLSKGGSEGEKIGELIGLNMVKHCPAFILALGEEYIENDESFEGNDAEVIKGKIKKITGEDLYVLEIKDTEGKTQKFVWLTNFEGSDELIELEDKSKGKKVEVSYKNIEFFSPKLKEYIVKKTITKLEFLD